MDPVTYQTQQRLPSDYVSEDTSSALNKSTVSTKQRRNKSERKSSKLKGRKGVKSINKMSDQKIQRPVTPTYPPQKNYKKERTTTPKMDDDKSADRKCNSIMSNEFGKMSFGALEQ